MVAKFLDHNNRELKQGDGDGNENGKKAIGLYKKNNNFTRALRYSVHFPAVAARLRQEIPNFKRPLYGVHKDKTTIKFSFPFSKLRYTVLSDWTPENFAIIWQIEWNWTRTMKFETVRIHFLSDVFCLFRSRKLATMATWRNDFSSALIDYI